MQLIGERAVIRSLAGADEISRLQCRIHCTRAGPNSEDREFTPMPIDMARARYNSRDECIIEQWGTRNIAR